MTLLDWLRKLGIIRFGTKSGTYTSARDMPREFLVDGVYNAEKDLVTKDDLKKVASVIKGSPAGCKCEAEIDKDHQASVPNGTKLSASSDHGSPGVSPSNRVSSISG